MATALLLGRQGHEVILVDRDPGPTEVADWARQGVMQFNLPHTLRAPGRSLLIERLPEVYAALLEVGAVDIGPAGQADPGGMLHVRRSVLERALWQYASTEVARVTGHVDSVIVDDGVARGLVVDGESLEADLVVDASGRAGRVSDDYRPEAEGADTGLAYAARLYQLRPGAEPGPRNGGPGYVSMHEGFLLLIFEHDAGTFTVLLVRLSSDRELAALRDEVAFEAALKLLPAASAWTDSARAYPIDQVRAGAGLVNQYRRQSRTTRRLLAVGDAVCTTNPAGARGLSLGLLHAAALADIVTGSPEPAWAAQVDRWGDENLLPWYIDHMVTDAALRRRWSGQAPDLDAPIPSDLVAAAAVERPEFMARVGPYFAMLAHPGTLDPLRAQVRQMLIDGWRPAPLPGPDRQDLVARIREVTRAVA